MICFLNHCEVQRNRTGIKQRELEKPCCHSSWQKQNKFFEIHHSILKIELLLLFLLVKRFCNFQSKFHFLFQWFLLILHQKNNHFQPDKKWNWEKAIVESIHDQKGFMFSMKVVMYQSNFCSFFFFIYGII